MSKQKHADDTYWKKNCDFLSGLIGKTELTPDEWKAISYETWAIASNHQTHPAHGGTVCSGHFRVATAHLELLMSGIKQPSVFRNEAPRLTEQIALMVMILEDAKDGLERHNSQSRSIVTYSLNTGSPDAPMGSEDKQ